MRYITFTGLFLSSVLVFAEGIDIKVVSQDNKTLYYLNAGAFSRADNAQRLQQDLSEKVNIPVKVNYLKDRSLYLVQMGPLNDYAVAKKIRNQLMAQSFISPNVSTAIMETAALPVPVPKNLKFTAQNENGNGNATDAVNEPPTVQDQSDESEAEPESDIDQPEDENPPPEVKAPPSPPAPARKNTTQTDKNPSKRLWNIRNADLRAVIAEVSRVTGKNFVIDPRLQGKISIVSSSPMDNSALYEVFLSVLQIAGYAAIPTGDIIKIIPNADAKTLSPNDMQQMFNPAIGDEMAVHVIPVHYVPAEQLVPVLRPLMPQWSNVSAYAPSNMLILTGRSNNIKRLSEIIKQVDTSSVNDIDIIKLRHSLAMDIASTLKDLTKTTPAGGAGGGGGGGGGGNSQITIATDDRSNSIILTGTKTDRIRIRMLIDKLDISSAGSQNATTKVIYLHYLRAEDLVPVLAGVAQANFSGVVATTFGTITAPILDSTNPLASLASAASSGSGEGGVGGPMSGPQPGTSTSTATSVSTSATSGTTQVTTQTESNTKPTVQIIAEPNTNSIIINAPAAIIRLLRTVIAQLDIKPAQLLIEAMVVEINETDVKNLGIEWGTVNGTEPTFSAGFAILRPHMNTNNFQAQIFDLVTKNKANILSTPSVIVLDNRQAKILVGQQVSIQTSSYPNNAGGTTGGTPFITYNRQNVALHLYVRPQITRGKGIQLQIDQGNDTLVPIEGNATSTTPVINVSSIVTSVQVESGDIIVLGGLMKDQLSNIDRNLGIVDNIPGLGRLFQHNIRTRGKQVLMVFIKPIILANEKDNVWMTDAKYNDLRQYQLDYIRSLDYEPTNSNHVMPNLVQPVLPRPFEPKLRTFGKSVVGKKPLVVSDK